MKKWIASAAAVLAVALLFFAVRAEGDAGDYKLTGRSGFSPAEIRAWSFLHYRMLDGNGVIRYLASPKTASADGVVESMGQAMEYLALVGDGELFARYAEVTDRYFKAKEGYYCWQVNLSNKSVSRSTALVDDLRLFKAYALAHGKKLGDYAAKLRSLAGDLHRFDVSGGRVVSFYNAENGIRDSGVNLFYLDTETMEQMERYDGKWRGPAKSARELLLAAPANKFGFYPTRYEYDKKSYTFVGETNLVENLYTAIFLLRAGGNADALAAFLKKEIAKGRIYNLYNTQTGRPVLGQGESTAVYALAARFLDKAGDKASSARCRKAALATQIGVGSRFMGAFSMDESLSVYAFDQLEALLMLRLITP